MKKILSFAIIALAGLTSSHLSAILTYKIGSVDNQSNKNITVILQPGQYAMNEEPTQTTIDSGTVSNYFKGLDLTIGDQVLFNSNDNTFFYTFDIAKTPKTIISKKPINFTITKDLQVQVSQ
jgi:hypothetical protein